jgi:molybdopterin/thiamine biosynthesis adenylyltransferase/ubiquitin-protein ligase
MMKWVMDDPARFLTERTEIEKLETEVDWLTTTWAFVEGLVVVDLDIKIHGTTYAGRMSYPSVFPNSPPYIRPRDSTERWSEHQYGRGGSLCLEWRADNWQSTITGADIMRSAYKLLTDEKHPERPVAVPSAHRLTAGQIMRSEEGRFISTNGLMELWLAQPSSSSTTFMTAKAYGLSAITMFVPKAFDVHGVEHRISDLPNGILDSLRFFASRGEGILYRSDLYDPTKTITSVNELIRVIEELDLPTDGVLARDAEDNKARSIVLLGSGPRSLRVFLVEAGDQPKLTEFATIASQQDISRLPSGDIDLSELRIGIVGLGSIGSKIAISLARSGIRQFVLVDDDYLAPGNMVRHELSWAYIGLHKVEAVSEELKLIIPDAQVAKHPIRMAGQESGLIAAAALKGLSNCDLLIDATANAEVFLLLAAIAKQYKKPLCWGEIFAGGYGGLIARANPRVTPNPLAVRDAIYAHLSTLPPAPYQNATGYDVEHEKPLLAHDSDVGFVATALTRLAIDTLSERSSNFLYSAYLIGMRKDWIFEQSFDIRPIDVQGPGWDGEEGAVRDEDLRAALEVMVGFIQGDSSADGGPAK